MTLTPENLSIEYTVIAIYFVILIITGWIFKSFSIDTANYFRGGSRVSWWLVGSSSFMVSITSITFTANAGIAFQAGWSAAYIYIGSCLGLLICAWFLAGWFRQLRVTTFPEIILLRYGKGFQQFIAYFTVINSAVTASIPLWGLSVFCSTIFGFPIEWVIIALGLIVLIYSTTGGSWAVMGTDFLQGLILVPTTIAVTVLCFAEMGGIGNFLNLIEERDLTSSFEPVKSVEQYPDGTYTLIWIISILLLRIFGDISAGSGVRYFAAKDGTDARKAALLSMTLLMLGMAFWFIPSMTSRILWESEVNAQLLSNPAEASYAVASLKVLPSGMVGLMVISMLAATMSTMDSGLNRNAAIVTLDIYPGLRRWLRLPERDHQELLSLSRLITCMFGFLIIIIALYFASLEGSGIFKVMFAITATLAFPILVPTVLGLFVRKVPLWAGFFSFGATLIPSLFSYFATEPWPLHRQLLTNVSVGSVAFLLTGFFWKSTHARQRERINRFFERMHKPVDFEKEVGGANDRSQARILGILAIIIGIFVLTLVLIPGRSGLDYMAIGIVAGMILGIGSLLLFLSRRG